LPDDRSCSWADPSDTTLKERITAIKTERDIAQVAFDRAVAEMTPGSRITEENIAAFAQTMRANVLNGEPPLRRASIRSVIMGGGASPAEVPSFVRGWRARRDSNS
jgi:site-specific DNA recombinase